MSLSSINPRQPLSSQHDRRVNEERRARKDELPPHIRPGAPAPHTQVPLSQQHHVQSPPPNHFRPIAQVPLSMQHQIPEVRLPRPQYHSRIAPPPYFQPTPFTYAQSPEVFTASNYESSASLGLFGATFAATLLTLGAVTIIGGTLGLGLLFAAPICLISYFALSPLFSNTRN